MEEQEQDGGIGTRWRNRNMLEEQEQDGGEERRWRQEN